MNRPPQCECLDCRDKRRALAYQARIANRRKRMRRVACPTNLPGVWFLRKGFTLADFEKAQADDSMAPKKGESHEKR